MFNDLGQITLMIIGPLLASKGEFDTIVRGMPR